jgi:hypothetical protein
VTALDPDGGSFIDDLEAGDLWYFPAGHPHSLQGLSPNGTEFLLIFDNGHFSEESTFLLTDWMGAKQISRISQAILEPVLMLPSSYIESRIGRKFRVEAGGLQVYSSIREIHLPGLAPRAYRP